MKIVEHTNKGFFVKNDKILLDGDFKSKSFLEQVLPHLESMPYSSPSCHTYLVFDQQEEVSLIALLKQLDGRAMKYSGINRGISGVMIVLNCILKPLNRSSTYIPRYFERDREKEVKEIEDWSLVIQ